MFPLMRMIGLLALCAGGVQMASAAEQAPYTVLYADNQYEIRSYPAMVLVEAQLSSSSPRRGSFGSLFRYITGNNVKAQEIEMTAPVYMNYSDNQMDSMAFVLPRKIALEEAPTPREKGVKLRQTKADIYASIRFSGRMGRYDVRDNRLLLSQWIQKNGLEQSGQAKAAGYDHPGVPGHMRRNEVLIPLKNNAALSVLLARHVKH